MTSRGSRRSSRRSGCRLVRRSEVDPRHEPELDAIEVGVAARHGDLRPEHVGADLDVASSGVIDPDLSGAISARDVSGLARAALPAITERQSEGHFAALAEVEADERTVRGERLVLGIFMCSARLELAADTDPRRDSPRTSETDGPAVHRVAPEQGPRVRLRIVRTVVNLLGESKRVDVVLCVG